jgi:hypothetical protein
MCTAAVAATALLVWAANNSTAGSANTSESKPDYVLRLIPDSGSQVLRQATVGLQVRPDYDAYLVINGQVIDNVAAKVGDDGLDKTDSLGLIEYTPAPGKRIEHLEPQLNTIIAFVWKRSDGPSTAKQVAWTITAT